MNKDIDINNVNVCNNCGFYYSCDDAIFCSKCGNILIKEPPVMHQAATGGQARFNEVKTGKETNSKGKMLIPALIAFAIMCSVIYIFFYYSNGSGSYYQRTLTTGDRFGESYIQDSSEVYYHYEYNNTGFNDDEQIEDAGLIIIENVINTEQAEAIKTFAEQGFIIEITKEYHDEVQAGYVISQTPAAGSKETQEAKIDLVVSLGPQITDLRFRNRASVDAIEIIPHGSATLILIVTPLNAEANITWSFDNFGVIMVVPSRDKKSAVVRGVAVGEAIVTATAGDISVSCTVRVVDTIRAHTSLRNFRDMITSMEDISKGVSLHISWTSESHAGLSTKLIREKDSMEWIIMHVDAGYISEVFPEFEHRTTMYSQSGFYMISFPEDDLGTYHFLENGRGYFLYSDSGNRLDFTWEFNAE